jgi:hypothetical protein
MDMHSLGKGFKVFTLEGLDNCHVDVVVRITDFAFGFFAGVEPGFEAGFVE